MHAFFSLPHREPRPLQQNGMALLVLVIFLLLGSLSFLLGSSISNSLEQSRQNQSLHALGQAKQALLAYAVTYGDSHGTSPGYLPCPDTGNTSEGTYAGSCGAQNISQIGKLPWKTLDIAPITDGSGECLWLAVAGTFKNSPKTGLLNWDTPGLFDIYAPTATQQMAGPSPLQRAVAVIYAPGATLPAQSRSAAGSVPSCGGNYVAGNYLDSIGSLDNAVISTVANGISASILAADSKITVDDSDRFNDKLVYISAQELFDHVERRKDFYPTVRAMLRYTAECVANYAKDNDVSRLPWAAPLALPDYSNDSSYDDQNNLLAGRIAFDLNQSRNSIFLQGGKKNGYMGPGSGISTTLLDYCPASPLAEVWRQNWKDQIFYALANAYKPGNTQTCSTGSCLSVNGSGSYAAVLIFSGRRLAALAQKRDTLAEKGLVASYLESGNASAVSAATGQGNFIQNTASDTFNDIVACIRSDFTVDENCGL